jgi:enterochelin esterase-like enzyme
MLLTLCLAALLLPASSAAAQEAPPCTPEAGVVITRSIDSAALGQTKQYTVYLPPDWCHLADLPLLVMLHGRNGDHTDWVNKGALDQAADTLILAGEIEPLIILMPDGDNSFYVNGQDGDYETYIVDELISAVDAEFPTAAARDSRFIGGLSMGGYGALYLGLRHPDLFSAIGAHSPAILSPEDAPFFLYGPDKVLFAERDIISLITRDGWPPHMRLFVDIGASDSLMRGVYNLFGSLFGQPLPAFEGHVWPGGHYWGYWSRHAPDYLRFYGGVGEEQ